MKIALIILGLALLPVNLLGQEESWEEQQRKAKERWEEQNRREKEAWDQRNREERQHWQDMINREAAAWQAHVNAVKQKWREIAFSDVKNWVGYGKKEESRFQADFENGNLKMEILGDQITPPEKLQQQAIEMLHELLREKAAANGPSILQDQLQMNAGVKQIPAEYINT
ncbi:MAG: hypothetical protein ACE5GL_11305, partial [Calditrichia bacterium]